MTIDVICIALVV